MGNISLALIVRVLQNKFEDKRCIPLMGGVSIFPPQRQKPGDFSVLAASSAQA